VLGQLVGKVEGELDAAQGSELVQIAADNGRSPADLERDCSEFGNSGS